MSRRIEELDAIVRQFDLNAHPFYVAWRAGELPIERLREYATEWAPFIAALDRGWDRIGEPSYAAEERAHDILWSAFRASLGSSGEMTRPQSATLVAVGDNAFAAMPEALGALYSFEVQQPATAQSKLAGLREHYAGTVDEAGQAYFVEHAIETDEPAMLAAKIDALSDDEFARTKTACAVFSAAAWGALDGVYYTD
jgi:pyrroloquinoline-quinone synthase